MARLTVAPMFVISMAVAAALMSGSGFTAWAGVGYDLGLTDVSNDLRGQAQEDVEGSVIGSALTLLGLAIAAISLLVDTFVWVYLFPFALNNLGIPWWFAYPVGLPVLYVNIIGTVSVLRGINIR